MILLDKLEFRGIEFGTDDATDYFIDQISGLDDFDTDVFSQKSPYIDGSQFIDYNVKDREIKIDVVLKSAFSKIVETRTLRDNLIKTLTLQPNANTVDSKSLSELRITSGSTVRVTDAVCTDIKFKDKKAQDPWTRCSITLFCPSPYFSAVSADSVGFDKNPPHIGVIGHIAYSSLLDIYISPMGSYVAYSKDGINWFNKNINYIIDGEIKWISKLSKFISYRISNTKPYYSSDGFVWVEGSGTVFSRTKFSFSDTANIAVAINGSTTEILSASTTIKYSSNLSVWNSVTVPSSYFEDIDWSPTLNLFCITAAGAFLTSANGTVWNKTVNGNVKYAVKYVDYLSSFVCGNGYKTTDGINWTWGNFTSLGSGLEMFVDCSNNSLIFSSFPMCYGSKFVFNSYTFGSPFGFRVVKVNYPISTILIDSNVKSISYTYDITLNSGINASESKSSSITYGFNKIYIGCSVNRIIKSSDNGVFFNDDYTFYSTAQTIFPTKWDSFFLVHMHDSNNKLIIKKTNDFSSFIDIASITPAGSLGHLTKSIFCDNFSIVFGFSQYILKIDSNLSVSHQLIKNTGPELFGAFSRQLGIVCIVSLNYIQISKDAITWDVYVHAFTPKGVVWGDDIGLFVMIGLNSVATSPDGKIWTNRTSQTGNWNCIEYFKAKKMFVCLESGGSKSQISYDGINWQLKSQSFSSDWNLIIDCDDYLTAMSYSSPISQISYDGINWNSLIGDNCYNQTLTIPNNSGDIDTGFIINIPIKGYSSSSYITLSQDKLWMSSTGSPPDLSPYGLRIDTSGLAPGTIIIDTRLGKKSITFYGRSIMSRVKAGKFFGIPTSLRAQYPIYVYHSDGGPSAGNEPTLSFTKQYKRIH